MSISYKDRPTQVLFLLLFTILVLWFYKQYLVIESFTDGYRYLDLQTEREAMRNEQLLLQVKILKHQSLHEIERKAVAQGFISAPFYYVPEINP